MGKERLQYLDNAKAFLIIMMVIAHIWQAGYVHDFIYTFHMGAFFMINGIQLSESISIRKPFAEFAKLRIYTMGIPFLFFEAYGWITYLIRYGFGQNIKGIIYNTVTLNFNNGVNWFLFTLFWAQLLIWITFKYWKHRNDVVILFYLVIGALLSCAENRYIFAFARILFATGLIFFGYTIKQSRYYSELCKKRYIIPAFVITLAVSLIMIPIGGIRGMDFGNPILALIGITSGTLLVVQAGQLELPEWVQWIGRNTLIIYGTHNAFYVSIGHYVGITDFVKTDLVKGMITFLCVCIIEIPIILLLNRFAPFLVGRKHKSWAINKNETNTLS